MNARRRSTSSSVRSSSPASVIQPDPAQRGGRRHAAGDAQRGDRDARVLGARGGEIEQHVPSWIGEQVAIEKLCAQLPLTDDPPHQPRIRQRRTHRAPSRPASLLADRRSGKRGFRSGARCPRRRRPVPRIEASEALGDLGDLFGNSQQRQAVIFGKLAQTQPGNFGEHAAEGEDAVGAGRVDEDLRGGLVAAGEHRVETGDGRRDDQVRPRPRRARASSRDSAAMPAASIRGKSHRITSPSGRAFPSSNAATGPHSRTAGQLPPHPRGFARARARGRRRSIRRAACRRVSSAGRIGEIGLRHGSAPPDSSEQDENKQGQVEKQPLWPDLDRRAVGNHLPQFGDLRVGERDASHRSSPRHAARREPVGLAVDEECRRPASAPALRRKRDRPRLDRRCAG